MGSTFERRVIYSPLPSQLQFHEHKARFKGFSGPVGSGKSAALCHEALRLAYVNGGCTGLIGAPTYPMLRDSTRAAFLSILEESRVPYLLQKAENAVTLPECGAMVLFRSLENYERLRGTNLAWFGVDELTYCRAEAWTRLEARLREPKATQLAGFAVWTPKGFDWVYRRFIATERKRGYDAVIAAPRENLHLPEGFYESLRESYDERFYQQEAEGQYLNIFSGQVYYNFDRKECVRPLSFDPQYPLCWALDFNVDPMSSVIAQVIDTTTQREVMMGKRSRVIHVLQEIVLPDCRTPMAVEEFLRRIEPLRRAGLQAIYVYGDASGANRHSSSLRSDWQQVKEMLRAALPMPITFRVPEANPPVRERVTAVCSSLRSESGERRLFVDPSCRELIIDFEEVGWKKDAAGNTLDEISKADPRRTHVSDALGYLVHKERKPVSGPNSTIIL